MKLVKSLGLLLLSGAFAFTANAQKIKVTEGSLDAVKGVTEYKLEFTYNDLAVGKFKDEAEYIAKKKEEYNKKEAGKGDKWAESWISDREGRFEPKFTELFTEYSKATVSDKAKYTLIFHTTFIEPGFNIGVMRKNAEINGEVTIVETANPGKVLAKLTITKSPGAQFGGYDFDTGVRIAEAYAKAGKEIGKKVK
ncbi:hypothetical protein ACFS6H_01865 [Terrimonas rubra]|jgi:hypothetical protein|uniref:DUF4468 domain-containing protein n=1 Tax=Terrimonas rubra TaxID=1035890 RepID=A0ABW5ZZI6_9BACT